jgi:hypothetical protein
VPSVEMMLSFCRVEVTKRSDIRVGIHYKWSENRAEMQRDSCKAWKPKAIKDEGRDFVVMFLFPWQRTGTYLV